MVPVRKPGRPLSVCSHPQDQPCVCGGITAAIPRKQTCCCSDDTVSQPAPAPTSNPGETQMPSPKRVQFKVHKTPVRKKTFDPANLERADSNQANIITPKTSHKKKDPSQLIKRGKKPYAHPSMPNGYLPKDTDTDLESAHSVLSNLPEVVTADENENSMNGEMVSLRSVSGNSSGINRGGESLFLPPVSLAEHSDSGLIERSCCSAKAKVTLESKSIANRKPAPGSCCTPNQVATKAKLAQHSVESTKLGVGNCCSSKTPTTLPENQSLLPNGSPTAAHPALQYPLLQAQMPFIPNLSSYIPNIPQPTLFTYPSTYGSFKNPLQPSAWTAYANSFAQIPPPTSMPLYGPQYTAPIPESSQENTVHSCSCGDSCQCIGCAAHPYNNATQEYVRSAWEAMAFEQQTGMDTYPSGDSLPSATIQGDSIFTPTNDTSSSISSPHGTSTISGAEESLSAADFFFVNYQFANNDECGGDNMSCPCGDDCQCLGCTIHRQPGVADAECTGDDASCPCGDDCQCLGCTIHRQPTAGMICGGDDVFCPCGDDCPCLGCTLHKNVIM